MSRGRERCERWCEGGGRVCSDQAKLGSLGVAVETLEECKVDSILNHLASLLRDTERDISDQPIKSQPPMLTCLSVMLSQVRTRMNVLTLRPPKERAVPPVGRVWLGPAP